MRCEGEIFAISSGPKVSFCLNCLTVIIIAYFIEESFELIFAALMAFLNSLLQCWQCSRMIQENVKLTKRTGKTNLDFQLINFVV